MAQRFEGKVALVVGGNAGIGLATAHAFAAEGARVMISGRRIAECEAAIDSIRAAGGTAEHVEADVTQAESVERIAAKLVAQELRALGHHFASW